MTINHARKILGKTSSKFSDEEIELLISQFYGIAETVTSIIGSKRSTMGIEMIKPKEDHGNSQ